ncbi:MAG: type II secretion system protein GspF [Myxococcales bacterium]|nr:type II secretion system protein GspF [Myxococcales bacterium]
MPLFEYKGFDAKGKTVKGVRDADSVKALRAQMRREGVMLASVDEAKAQNESEVEVRLGSGRIDVRELAVVTRQFAVLLRSGIPLVPALTALAEQVDNPRLARMLGDVKTRVNEGASLGDALANHPKAFNTIYVNMVRAGESSGALDVVLERLADFTENQAALKGKVIGALIYPLVMIIAGGAIMIGLFIFVIPRISKIFEHADAQLPLLTRILMGLSELLSNPILDGILALIAVAALILLRQYIKTEGGRLRWDAFKLRFPKMGEIHRMIAIARFSRTLATLLSSGVNLLQACKIARNVMNNEVLARVVDEAAVAVSEGQSLAAPLKKSGEFPPIVYHMVAIGEQTGQLEEMLANVARGYEQEVEVKVSTLTSLLEPFLILFMGGVIFTVVMAVLTPILQMNQFIK